MQWQHESESKSEASKQGEAEDFAAASIAAKIKTHNQRQARQGQTPCRSLGRKEEIRGKQSKAGCLEAASIATKIKTNAKSKQSKAKPDALLSPQAIHHQSIQSSLITSYPVIRSNRPQQMLGRVASPTQVSQTKERMFVLMLVLMLMLELVLVHPHHLSCFVICNSLTLSASSSNMPNMASRLGPFFLCSLALSECSCLWISAN